MNNDHDEAATGDHEQSPTGHETIGSVHITVIPDTEELEAKLDEVAKVTERTAAFLEVDVPSWPLDEAQQARAHALRFAVDLLPDIAPGEALAGIVKAGRIDDVLRMAAFVATGETAHLERAKEAAA